MSLTSGAMASASASLNDVAPEVWPGPILLPGRNHQQVAAHAGDLLLDLEGGAAADGHHGDHGRHADDDAQDGQKRAQDVAPDLAQGQKNGIADHDDFPPFG